MISLSVVIPLYNKENHIQRAIRSVLAQTYQEFELIIVDDGSTDDSYEIAGQINDPRIKIIHQDNQGVSSARNRGVADAQFDWVTFLDADDEWKPDFLAMIIDLHNKYPECGLLATAYIRYRNSGFDYMEYTQVNYPNGWSGIITNYYFDLRIKVPFCSSSFAVKKNILQDVGNFPVGISVGEDVNVWIKLYQVTGFAYRKEIGAIYYLDDDNHVSRPLHELFNDYQKDYTHGDLLRQILFRKQFSRREYIPIIELLAKNDIPIIRMLIKKNQRLVAIKKLWTFKSTKIYKKKWMKLFFECILPRKILIAYRKIKSNMYSFLCT